MTAAACTTYPLCACNTTRINPNLLVTLALTKDTADGTGIARAKITSGTNSNQDLIIQGTNDGTSVTFKWGDICAKMGAADPTCATVTSSSGNTLSVTIYLDKDNGSDIDTDEVQAPVTFTILNPGTDHNVFGTNTQGIDAFSPYPGDAKVYIEGTNSPSGFSFIYGGTATAMRVFAATTSLNDAHAANSGVTYSDIAIDSTSSPFHLENNYIDGLENQVSYYFRIAMVDNGNNIVQYYPEYNDTGNGGSTFGTECTSAPDPTTCIFSATPTEVLGLLTKDVNCFIATAAYGSSFEPKLKTFRDFRFKVLLRHDWGVWFVKKYYVYGPYAARFIYNKPILRAVTRGLLWPLYAFARLSLRYGFTFSVMLFFSAFAAVGGLAWLGLRRPAPRV
jgi:hypothetical protein